MDFKFDLSKIEQVFSENFSSSIYLILVSEYLKNNDIGRAETVLKIGREHYPDSILGKYLLAKTYLLKDEINKSQSLLSSILKDFPIHLKARKLLIEIYRKKNDHKNIDKNVVLLQKYFPNQLSSSETTSKEVLENKSYKADKFETEKAVKEFKEKPKVEISKNMATFTFVDILISQKHYSEALVALDMLEKKGRSLERINKKRKQIKKIDY
jgi:hypothetical protein